MEQLHRSMGVKTNLGVLAIYSMEVASEERRRQGLPCNRL